MAEAWVLDTTLDPAFVLGGDEKLIRAAIFALPAGSFVILAKVVTTLYEGVATYRLAATHATLIAGAEVIAEDKSTAGLFVEYVEEEFVEETVSLSLVASLPLGGLASVHAAGSGTVSAVNITALQVDAIHLTPHHEAQPSTWHPR